MLPLVDHVQTAPLPVAPPPVLTASHHTAQDLQLSLNVIEKTSSSNSSTDTIAEVEEKGKTKLAWEGYEDDYLPSKAQVKPVRNLRHILFTIYRRIFGVIFIVNMSIFISTAVRGFENANYLGLVVVANLFASILMRQEYVVNSFFIVFGNVPRS